MLHNIVGFYGEELLARRPKPKAGGPSLVGCPRVLVQCTGGPTYPLIRYSFFQLSAVYRGPNKNLEN
jgi:hypothetical protein